MTIKSHLRDYRKIETIKVGELVWMQQGLHIVKTSEKDPYQPDSRWHLEWAFDGRTEGCSAPIGHKELVEKPDSPEVRSAI